MHDQLKMEFYRLVLPSSRIAEVLRKFHDGTSGAHHEINKTLDKVRQLFHCLKRRHDTQWIKLHTM